MKEFLEDYLLAIALGVLSMLVVALSLLQLSETGVTKEQERIFVSCATRGTADLGIGNISCDVKKAEK